MNRNAINTKNPKNAINEIIFMEVNNMPCGRKRKRAKMAKHKRKKRMRKNRHKKRLMYK